MSPYFAKAREAFGVGKLVLVGASEKLHAGGSDNAGGFCVGKTQIVAATTELHGCRK